MKWTDTIGKYCENIWLMEWRNMMNEWHGGIGVGFVSPSLCSFRCWLVIFRQSHDTSNSYWYVLVFSNRSFFSLLVVSSFTLTVLDDCYTLYIVYGRFRLWWIFILVMMIPKARKNMKCDMRWYVSFQFVLCLLEVCVVVWYGMVWCGKVYVMCSYY